MSRRPRAVTIPRRTRLTFAVASVAGMAAFVWPLLVEPGSRLARGADAAFVFVLILPAVVGVVLAEVSGGAMDSRAVALLGTLSALGAALRPLGAGLGGIETVFFLLVLAGRVFGPGFGFVLGSTTMFASALLTAGVGPWLPFQMLAASWVGLGAGLLPPVRGRIELALLAVYGAASAIGFGLLMNLWGWPFALGPGTALSYVAGAPVAENLQRFAVYSVTTSLGWDLGRAATNVVLITLAGPAILAALRRASRRAAFASPVGFQSPPSPDEVPVGS